QDGERRTGRCPPPRCAGATRRPAVLRLHRRGRHRRGHLPRHGPGHRRADRGGTAMTPTFGSAPSGTRPHKTTPALSLVDFSASYGGRNVLSGVTVDIPSAALAAVVGPNGAGKSTLVKAALGLVPSTQGRVRLLGQPLSRVRRKVAYVPQQDSVTKDFPITAVQVVEMGRYPHRGWWRRLTPTDDELVAQAMEQVGVVDLADRPIDELSGGQRQRVFLARALAQRAELVVLDEPFTDVDARTESALVGSGVGAGREGGGGRPGGGRAHRREPRTCLRRRSPGDGLWIEGLLSALPLSYPDAVVVVGAAVVGFVAGALGPLAVLRRRSMFGDAMSHGTLTGVAVACLATGAKVPETLLLGATISAALAAFAMIALERTGRLRPDAAIGVVLSVSLALGIVLITHISATENSQQSGLTGYLLGQTAGMSERDIAIALVLGAVALAAVTVGFRVLRSATFEPGFTAVVGVPTWAVDAASTGLLALAVVLGVRTVGAILMVALLVAPVVAARQVTKRLSTLVPLSGLVGAVCGALGGVLSGHAELPAGPVIVLLATGIALVSVVFAPYRGVLARVRKAHRKE